MRGGYGGIVILKRGACKRKTSCRGFLIGGKDCKNGKGEGRDQPLGTGAAGERKDRQRERESKRKKNRQREGEKKEIEGWEVGWTLLKGNTGSPLSGSS